MQRRIDHVFIYAIAQVLFIFFVMRLQKKKKKKIYATRSDVLTPS